MWKFKTCKTQTQLNRWVEKNSNKYEFRSSPYHTIFMNNAYGVEYRKLKKL